MLCRSFSVDFALLRDQRRTSGMSCWLSLIDVEEVAGVCSEGSDGIGLVWDGGADDGLLRF